MSAKVRQNAVPAPKKPTATELAAAIKANKTTKPAQTAMREKGVRDRTDPRHGNFVFKTQTNVSATFLGLVCAASICSLRKGCFCSHKVIAYASIRRPVYGGCCVWGSLPARYLCASAAVWIAIHGAHCFCILSGPMSRLFSSTGLNSSLRE